MAIAYINKCIININKNNNIIIIIIIKITILLILLLLLLKITILLLLLLLLKITILLLLLLLLLLIFNNHMTIFKFYFNYYSLDPRNSARPAIFGSTFGFSLSYKRLASHGNVIFLPSAKNYFISLQRFSEVEEECRKMRTQRTRMGLNSVNFANYLGLSLLNFVTAARIFGIYCVYILFGDVNVNVIHLYSAIGIASEALLVNHLYSAFFLIYSKGACGSRRLDFEQDTLRPLPLPPYADMQPIRPTCTPGDKKCCRNSVN